MKRARSVLVFVALATMVAMVFWICTDWRTYIEIGGTLRPKFEFPMWFQIVQSSVVGLIAVGVPAFVRAKWLAMRAERRIESGLCPKCAYPVGTNEVCTECGAAVGQCAPASDRLSTKY